MDFSYSQKYEAIRTQVRDFIDDNVVPRLGLAQKEFDRGRLPLSFMGDSPAGIWRA